MLIIIITQNLSENALVGSDWWINASTVAMAPRWPG